MLYAQNHPESISKVISLDSLRYPFPTGENIAVLSLRAIDTKADEGVLPTTGATIIELKDAKHIDLSDRGEKTLKKEIVGLISTFLIIKDTV